MQIYFEEYLKMRRGKAPRRPAEVPTGLLDAYTESSPSSSTMSDSDKFKEGYVKKKDKGKQKRTNKKSETEEVTEDVKEEEEVEVQESWDAEEEVIESWDQLEVEEMPVPQKVKQVMRKEEKKRKKEEKKAQEKPAETPYGESTPAEVEKSPEPSNDDKKEEITKSDAIVKDMAAMTVTEGKQPNKEYTEEEKAAIKAEREAKKAAKANKKAGNKIETKSDDKESPQAAAVSQPESSDGKTKEQQKAERKAAFELAQKQKVEAGEAAAGGKEGEKSKAELKAERRAKQEAQRAAKEAAKEVGQKKVPEGKQSKEPKVKVPDEIKADDKKVEKKLNKTLKDQNIASRTKVQRQVGLFSHLHQYERELSVTRNLPIVGSNIHPCIIQLGLQHAEGEIVGSSARCISLLSAIKSLLLDSLQQLTSSSDINKELDNLLKPNIVFLRQVISTNFIMTATK